MSAIEPAALARPAVTSMARPSRVMLPLSTRMHSAQGAQQRRFSDPVGTDERQQFARANRQRDAGQNAAAAVTERDVANVDHPARRRNTRKRKIGTPNIDSSTPTGKSSGGAIERATASARTTSMAPISALVTSV